MGEDPADLREELARLRRENAHLRRLLALDALAGDAEAVAAPRLFAPGVPLPDVDAGSPPADKVALFRTLFVGRQDVYARRWENTRTGESGWVPAVEGGWAGRQGRPGRDEYLPLTDDVIDAHLRGRETIGIFPLLRDDRCRLLAFDLDGERWLIDAVTLVAVCDRHGVPAVLERSRSGVGGHVWIFLTEPVAAGTVRRLGASLLRETMAVRGELDLASYDRMFPSQDLLPKGGFGNLIAAPLQGASRRAGNTVFLDPSTGEPFDDQWAFLSGITRLAADSVPTLADELDPPAVWRDLVAGRRPAGGRPPPDRIAARLSTGISVDTQDLPPWLLAAVKHLASLDNPEFHRRQRLRLSTHETPRFVRCYREDLTHLHLPRGLLTELEELVTTSGSELDVDDRRPDRDPLALAFRGELTGLQRRALDEVLAHDLGVLVAPPGTGKTVMACAAIAARSLPTLVLVHRTHLLEQWRGMLTDLLGLDDAVGAIGGGADGPGGRIDVAMLQTLTRRDGLEELFAGYGMIVADECHHIPARTFEQVMWAATPQHVLGLTATPYRKDGLEGIIAMQCGPTRHRIDIAETPAGRELSFQLHVHTTNFSVEQPGTHIQDIFAAVAEDESRTADICRDIADAVDRGRRCLVLTERRDHLAALVGHLQQAGLDPPALHGGISDTARRSALEEMASLDAGVGAVIVATGPYIGEGLDCPPLDTLFVTFPVSFRGRIVQYVGRLLRITDAKDTVEVHDYLDAGVEVLRSMHSKRRTTYRRLGFTQP